MSSISIRKYPIMTSNTSILSARRYRCLYAYLHAGVLLAACMLTGTTALEARAQDKVTVFLDSTAQTIRGFGAAYIHFWRPDMTDAEIETAFGTGEGQLGFSILRLGIDPNPARWGENVRTAKKAYDMGVLIFASPWNAPADMLKPGPGSDTVAVDKYDEYAAHLKAFNDYMSANGVELYAISVQNEPDYAEDWTGWSPEGMVKFLRENAPSIGTRIIAPESFQFRRAMSDPILNDSLAAAHTDIIGGHIYGGGLSSYPLALEKGKEVWMTEHLTESSHSANVWSYAMDVGTEMQGVMNADMSAYVWWYLVRYYGPIADGEVSASFPNEDYGRKGDVTKKGYVMSQFSRFIRPGYVRVHTKKLITRGGGFSRVSVTAYRDSTRMVLVATNPAAVPADVELTLEGGTAARFSRYVTSETQNVERMDDVEVSGNTFTITLGAGSVTTLVADYASNVSAEEAVVPAPHQLSQNYPNPFSGVTTIGYTLPRPGDVRLEVLDLLGRKVATLAEGGASAGSHQITFDASGLAGGVYVYRLTTDQGVQTRRMMVIR